MPYTGQHWHVSFIHTIASTDELAVTGLKIRGGEINIGLMPDATFANACRSAWGSFVAARAASIGAYSHFQGVKVAPLDANGKYVQDATVANSDGSIAGTANVVVPQASVVLSLFSGSKLGKGNYGRIYVPHSGVPGAGTPLIDTTTQAAWADDADNLLTQINTAAVAAAGAGASIRIMGASTALGAATEKVAVQVRVGRVVDTQRRRRSALDESFVARAL